MKARLLTLSLSLLTLGSFAQTVWEDFDNPSNAVYNFVNGISFDEMYANPDNTGINTSALCGSYERNGAVQFDVIVMDPAGANAVGDVGDYLTGAKELSIKLYSPAPGITVQITLEDPNSAGPTNYPTGRHSEYLATTTTTNQWETLTFALDAQPDMSVSNTSVNRLVLLFDPGNFSNTTFIWDDLMGPEFNNPCNGVTPDPSILEDFECQQNINYTFTNGNYTTVANPVTGGINTSAMCGKFMKFPPPTNDGAFGGPLVYPFNTGTYNTATFQLYSPAAPQDFLFIVQDGSPATLVEETVTTSNASEWESFTVDLSSIPSSTTVENIVLLLDPSTDTEDTIFIDNFVLSLEAVGIAANEAANNVAVYPVPFDDQLQVNSEMPIEAVQLTNVNGQIVWEQAGSNTNAMSIDAAALPSGVYFVSVWDNQGNVTQRKIVK